MSAAGNHTEGVAECDPTIIPFDLETTGLIRGTEYPHITQLAACNPADGKAFNKYIIPKKPIDAMASKVTGITMKGDKMFFHGQEVPAVPIADALNDFFSWLEQYKSVILLAHNGKRFDFPILSAALQAVALRPRFLTCVAGCVDTLVYFRAEVPGRSSYKQEDLVRDVLGETYGAHDALEDVRALGKLFCTQSVQKIMKYSFSPNSVRV